MRAPSSRPWSFPSSIKTVAIREGSNNRQGMALIGRRLFEAAFPGLEVVWLPTQLHDDAVLLVTRAMLEDGLEPPPKHAS